MKLFNIIAMLITLSALFGYLNHRFIKLPKTIGIMLISVIMSLALVALGRIGPFGLGIEEHWEEVVKSIDFNQTLMVGMLGFLLFAGAFHINLNELLKHKWEIAAFATVGVLLSTLLVGTMTFFVLSWLHLKMRFVYCMLFGALISPTDPIAVLGIMKDSGAPKSLETKISGESLFNDGIGVVVFIVVLDIAMGSGEASASEISLLFLKEAAGGAVLGLVLGWVAYLILKSVDNYTVEILVTLSLVTGGYSLASALHTSGPIAIVIAGLLIGNHGRELAMSEQTRENIDTFWELIDEILNAILFVLIGIELIVVPVSTHHLMAGLIAIPVAVLSRLISVGIPGSLFSLMKRFNRQSLKIMTWGGLRGGISVALALSLPLGVERDTILTMTYMVVVFSILVQGLTIRYLFEPGGNPAG